MNLRAIRIALLCAAAAVALASAQPGLADDAPAAHVLDNADLEAFFDGIIPLQLERSDIAGAAVLVMKDGRTLLQKGYGYSDLKPKQPVDPNSTIFRLASISKLFTWIAVMQLVEAGKLDLDVDIGGYLDFPIRSTPAIGGPITLRNLMTHTGGFEETVRNVILTEDKYYRDLREYLVQNQPNRLFAPGTVPAYSNYGVGLGSYIVQRVSGEPFERYVAEHIFTPLGMIHSTFYQPPPKALQDLPSQGYPSSTRKPAVGFERFSPVGAGGLSSSAADMGRFGSALLNGGELDGRRILSQESLNAMWKPQVAASAAMPPLGLGFYQVWRNELKWIGHQGDLIAFHSLFFLEPQQKLIIFVSYNSAGSAARTRAELLNSFSDRYFPHNTKQAFINLPRKDLQDIQGVYQSTRRADSTLLKLLGLIEQRHVNLDKDGVLHSDQMKDRRGHPINWKPVAKDLWQETDGQNNLFAIRAADGRIVRLAGAFPGSQLQRVPWYEQDYLVYAMLGISLAIVLSVSVAALVRLARRYVFRSSEPIPRPGTLPLGAISKATAAYWVIVFATLAVLLAVEGGDDAAAPTPAWDKYLFIGDVLCAIAVGLSILAALSAIRVWQRAARPISRVKFTLVGMAGLFLSWFVLHWNVIGPIHRL
jgi:CubicO group peptidase (beta-lactamase class C family)